MQRTNPLPCSIRSDKKATLISASVLLMLSACSPTNTAPVSAASGGNPQAAESTSNTSGAADRTNSPQAKAFVISSKQSELSAQPFATFSEPWAMSFLPSGDLLVTQKTGELELLKLSGPQAGEKLNVTGTPKVAYGGQGGLGDVVVDPDFANNSLIWLSYIQSIGGKYGAVVIKAKLETGDEPKLTQIQKIWEQTPLMSGQGHYSHRIAVGPAGTKHAGFIFITSGDRQEQTPAQNFSGNLGKVIRLKTDGSVPSDNPWQDKGEVARQFYSMGHRNLLGIDFDAAGSLWAHEMGPRHGDELNLILPGKNYGWPVVSNGDNYSGVPIPDHDTRPEFEQPKVFWVPAISPAGFSIYQGQIKDWQGSAFIGGLSSQALIEVNMKQAQEKQRFEWGSRVREVETGADGAIWVLEDGSDARLLKLMPKSAP